MLLNTVNVTVSGKAYQLSGTETPAYYQRLGALVDSRMKENAQLNPGLSPEARAVAVCLSLADELARAREEAALLRRQLEEGLNPVSNET